METSTKMIWIFFILSSAFADKLDRGYLPPPGSNFSGGSPGIIELPFEHPKSEYNLKNEFSKPPPVAIGIDRVDLLHHPKISSKSTTLTPSEASTTHRLGSNHLEPVNTSQNLADSLKPNTHQDKSNDQVFDLSYNSQPTSMPLFNDLLNEQHRSEQQSQYYSPSTPSLTNNLKYYTTATPRRNQDEADIHQDKSNDQVFDLSSNSRPTLMPLFNDLLNEQYGSKQQSQYFSPSTPSFTNNLKYSTTATPRRIQDEADREAAIINYNNVITPEGYAYSYDTSNKIHADESAETLNGVKAKGSYSYWGDDGKLYNVTYTADENGFRPQGDHLPTPHPIPDAILKVIEQAYKDKEAGIFDDGSYDDSKYGYKNYLTDTKDRNLEGFSKNRISTNKKYNFIPNNYINSFEDLTNKKNNNKIIVNKYQRPNKQQISKINENEGFEYIQPQKDTIYNLDTEVEIKNKMDISNVNGAMYPEDQSDFKKDNNQIVNLQMSSDHNTGYQYNRPQNLPQEFTTRLSDSRNINTEKPKEMNKATRKPFQTPNVTLKDEDMKEYNFNEGTIDDLQNIYDDNVIHNNHYHNSDYDDVKNPEEVDVYDQFLMSEEKGYSYGPKDTNKDMKDLFTNNLLTGPSAFSSRFNNNQVINSNNISVTQTTTDKNTFPTSSYPPNAFRKGNDSFGSTTLRTFFLDKNRENILSSGENVNVGNVENETKNNQNLPTLMSSTHIPRIGATYAPYIDILDDNKQYTKEKNIGEDFSGPKQSQRFDAASGYYYK